jgi:uncharacterized protein (TIGR02246 family)
MDDSLRELVEARAIEQLMINYIDRIDANDPVGAAACFTEDGVGVYWGEYRGRVAIAERLTGILDRFEHTSHHLSNVAATIDGDRAVSQAYVYAFHRWTGTNDFLHYWGRWVDELRKVDGRWLFARREVVGVGSYVAGDAEKERSFPGHPGRIRR